MRVTTEVTEHLRAAPERQTPPVSQRLAPPRNAKRHRQWATAARRRPRRARVARQGSGGTHASRHRAAECRSGRGPASTRAAEPWGTRGGGGVEPSLRMSCWGAGALQEATRRVQRRRACLCGPRRTPHTPPASAAAAPSRAAPGAGAGGGQGAALAEAAPGCGAVGGPEGAGTAEGEAVPTPPGGHRRGTGRLGAEAAGGAERTACRQAERAVGPRCPVGGQGPVSEGPPGSARRDAWPTRRGAACGAMGTASLPRAAGEE